MLSNDELKEMRKHTEIMTTDLLSTTLRKDVLALLDELDRVRTLHREEQRRSAERLANTFALLNNEED